MSPRSRSRHARPAGGTAAPESRFRGDDGAAMVEFALALPMLVYLFVSIVEYGFAYRQGNLLDNTVLVAARTASQQQKSRLADYQSLQAFSAGLGSLKNASLQRVIIWKANTNTSPVPPANCLSITATGTTAKGVSGSCNVYSAAQVNTVDLSGFPGGTSTAQSCTGAWDAFWCPLSRINADGSQDYIGVWAEIKSTSFTKFVPNGALTMGRGAIYRIEPPYTGG